MSKRRIELDSLLEITQAINANISAEDLYRVFYFSCMSLLRSGHIALFVSEKQKFVEKFSHSLSFNAEELNGFADVSFRLNDVQKIRPEIEQLFVIKHKDRILAVLFIGKQNVEELEISFSFLQTLSNIVMVAIENKRLAKATIEQERLAKESEIAREVQEQLIPRNLPYNDTIQVASIYFPHQSVGGDYYDVIPVGDKDYIICIADVSGKGVPAALIMSNFQATLKALARMTTDVELLVKDLNRHLVHNASSDHFVTCFIGHYRHDTRTIEYVNAGHNHPFLINGDRVVTLGQGCFMLGAFKDISVINKGKLYVAPDSKLFLYTDGISETVNSKGEEYGEERLLAFLLKSMEDKLALNLANLIIELDDFRETENYPDDLTALNIKFL